jgi:hypothetical protein
METVNVSWSRDDQRLCQQGLELLDSWDRPGWAARMWERIEEMPCTYRDSAEASGRTPPSVTAFPEIRMAVPMQRAVTPPRAAWSFFFSFFYIFFLHYFFFPVSFSRAGLLDMRFVEDLMGIGNVYERVNFARAVQ